MDDLAPKDPQTSFEEKRAYKRFSLLLPAQYKLAAFQESLTESSTLDISANGLKLRIKEKPCLEEEIHIHVELPEKGKLVLAAKVIWFKTVEESSEFETGIKLMESSSPDRKTFVDFYSREMMEFMEENSEEKS